MIGRFSLEQISARLQGRILGGNADFAAVSIDTRMLQPGALFVAIKGPNFNGHQFAAKAKELGASALLVSEQPHTDLPALLVKDTREALGQLGAINRGLFNGRVLAMTGSAGKTTVKEMAAAILGQEAAVLATKGNFNNEIGVPLTLLEITDEHEYAVLELGASSIGEIEYTVSLTRPDVAILTNAADAHIEGFGSLNNIVQAKGEIIDGLDEQGVAILNADDLNCYKWIQRAGDRKVCTFSLDEAAGAEFYARNISESATGASGFVLVTPQGEIDVQLRHLGRHNVANALAAAAGTMNLGAGLEQIKQGLESAQPVAGRLTECEGLNGARVIDDSYNANPESLRAAIDVLAGFSGRKILVLGDMAELGENSLKNHAESGRYARQAGVNALFALGPFSAHAAREFGDNGWAFDDRETLVEKLSKALDGNTTVLVKGSRSARMELVVQTLTGGEK